MLGWFSSRVFMGAAQRRLFAHGTAILTYHKLGHPAAGTRDPFLYTRTNDFDAQLKMLSEAAYRTVALDEVAPSHPVRGEEGAPRRIAITFDDGFVSALREGLPILARHNVRAIQFIVAGLVGKQNRWDVEKRDVAEPLMDEAQIREWLAAGHQIGSHSLTHRNLKKLSPAEAREEIIASKKLLEDKFGVGVRHFCYPFGGWNPAVRDLVIEAGYSTACTVASGVNPPGYDPFTLRRIMPYSGNALLRKVIHRVLRRAR
jgi:peptidoglycan/xylan/chitin deacetylase (PgdA/CDA1 family)